MSGSKQPKKTVSPRRRSPPAVADRDTRAALARAVERLTDAERVAREAREEASTSMRARSELLASLGGALRGPVAELRDAVRLIDTAAFAPATRSAFRAVQRAAEKLGALTQDLLDEPPGPGGRAPSAPFDLAIVLRDILDEASLQAEQKGVALDLRYRSDTPRTVIADEERVGRLASHLVTGAIEVCETGTLLLEALCVQRDVDGLWIELRAGPAGADIGEAERSAGASAAAPDVLPGFAVSGRGGVALALSERIAMALGGAAGVRGGAGAVFWARLPFGAPVAQAADSAPLSNVRVAVLRGTGPSAGITAERIESWGGHVTTIPSVDEAVAVLRDGLEAGEPIAAIVVHATDEDSLAEDLASRVRSDASLRRQALLVVAPRGRRGDAKRYTDAGYDAYLAGPVRDGVLLAALRMLVERDTSWYGGDRRSDR